MRKLIDSAIYGFKKARLYMKVWRSSGVHLKYLNMKIHGDITEDEYKMYNLHEFLDLLDYKHKLMPAENYPDEWCRNDYEDHRNEIKRKIGLLEVIDVKDVRGTAK